MIKTEKKLVTIQREEESITLASCDCCHKDLELVNERYSDCEKDSKVIHRYVSLTTSHHDWGNDSVDSIESHEFCSMKCCLKWITEHEKELKSNTREFNIECDGTY